jgi:hypothetical protein
MSIEVEDRTDNLARPVSQEEYAGALLRALMVGPVRALDLIKRVPDEFKLRGWPDDPDSHAVAACAIGAYKIGAGAQRFRLPPALMAQPEWMDLALRSDEHKPSAVGIVEKMELRHLLEPV